MRAVEYLRARPACWLLAALFIALGAKAISPAAAPAGSSRTNRPALSVKRLRRDSAPDTNTSAIPALPKPAPVHRADLPSVFMSKAPSSVADLRSMQRHVEALAARVSPSVVAVEIGSSSGSGVVVTADGLVLTAGHVCGAAGRPVRFTFPDGLTVHGTTLGKDDDSDTGLMRITSRGTWPHAPMGDLAQARLGDWVLALGHPGGFDRRRSLVVRLGRIIRLDEDALQTDCTISPGDSGGPLLDMYGRVIGIHSAISTSLAENFHVAATAFYDNWNVLAKVTGEDEEVLPVKAKPAAPSRDH